VRVAASNRTRIYHRRRHSRLLFLQSHDIGVQSRHQASSEMSSSRRRCVGDLRRRQFVHNEAALRLVMRLQLLCGEDAVPAGRCAALSWCYGPACCADDAGARRRLQQQQHADKGSLPGGPAPTIDRLTHGRSATNDFRYVVVVECALLTYKTTRLDEQVVSGFISFVHLCPLCLADYAGLHVVLYSL